MKNNLVCPACGRKRKKSHEDRAETPSAYHPNCLKYGTWKKQRETK